MAAGSGLPLERYVHPYIITLVMYDYAINLLPWGGWLSPTDAPLSLREPDAYGTDSRARTHHEFLQTHTMTMIGIFWMLSLHFTQHGMHPTRIPRSH